MKSIGGRHAVWPLIAGVVLGAIALAACPAFAALTFSGTSISGTSNVIIDSSSTISIGTSTATAITIGQAGITTTFPGTVSILGVLLDPNGNKYVTSTSGGSVSSTNNITFLYPASSSVAQTLTSKLSAVLSVTDFGAKGDGVTDDTAAIQAAISAATTGDTLLFPCENGQDYLVDSPISFAGKQRLTIEGTNNQCQINYEGTRSQPYAFSLVGADTLSFENIKFYSGSSNPPEVVLLLGRSTANGAAGHHIFEDVNVEGYATRALVYSIASEENTWLNDAFYLNGGGAKYVYYTSTADDLSVDSLPSSSNLSVWFSNFHLNDFSPTIDSTHSLVYIGGTGGGDSVFRDGYFSSASGTAVTIAAYSSNFGGWTFDSNRFENGQQFFYLNAPSQTIQHIRLTNNTLSSNVSGGMMVNSASNTILTGSTIEGNSVSNTPGGNSVFPIVQSSTISEDYPFTTQGASNSIINNQLNGTLSAPSYCINGANCITSWPGSSSSTWSQNGTALYYTTGNVGIGTTTPAALLDIYSPSSTPEIHLTKGSANNGYLRIYDDGSPHFVDTSSNSTIYFGSSILMSSNASVILQSVSNAASSTGSNRIWFGGTSDNVNAAMGGANSSQYRWLQINSGSGGSIDNTLYLNNHVSSSISLASGGGNVGIGTATPATSLQIATASSTVRIGASSLPGCLEMGNSNGTAGINYITVLNGVLTATTTNPGNCQ